MWTVNFSWARLGAALDDGLNEGSLDGSWAKEDSGQSERGAFQGARLQGIVEERVSAAPDHHDHLRGGLGLH